LHDDYYGCDCVNVGCDNGDNDGDDVYDDGLLRDAQSTERPVMSLPAKHKKGTKLH
jgi:hypothetical protein